MTAADEAYNAAVEEIRRVKEAGENRLHLLAKPFRALDRIPDEIATLDGLHRIDLDGTAVTDLAPLSGLTSLQSVRIDQTSVADLAPLASLTALKNLWLNQTSVADLAPLASLTSLQNLWLSQTAVANLAPLARLNLLQCLWLDKTSVADLTPLASLSALRDLRLNQTPVADLAPLTSLTALQNLWLNQTAVADLAPLSRLTALQRLWLDQTTVADLIPLADLKSLQILSLSGTAVTELAPLSNLTGLLILLLNQTDVVDLSPIAGLVSLSTLDLDGSMTSDLRPIGNLANLSQRKKDQVYRRWTGLSFLSTPAIVNDAELARLSGIKDDEIRTRETLAYLATLPPWPEPLDGPVAVDPPDQDPGLPLVWGPEGFAFLAAKVDSDPVTEAALEDLRSLLDDLRRKGNQHDDLFRLAGEMQDRSAGPIADLKMVRLHLSYQKLRRLYQGREARTEGFDDETVSVLGAVLEIVPGVTMADTGVKVLIERQEADRARPSAPDIVAAEDAVLAAVLADDAPFAPEVKDIAGTIRQPGYDDRLAATRGILSRNAAVVVLKYLGNVTVAGIIGNYAYTHMPEILALARTMGDDAFTWAQMVFASFKVEYEASVGILRETLTSGAIRSQRKPPKDVNEP